MKTKLKILIPSVIAAIGLLAGTTAFADTLNVVPITANTGNENSINISFTATNATFYLFDVSGNGLIGASGAYGASGSGDWSSFALPTGLTPEVYTLLMGNRVGGDNSFCSTGHTLSGCEAFLGASSIIYTTQAVTITNLPPTISYFRAYPLQIAVGSSSVLSWGTTNAATTTINGVVVSSTGMLTVSPTSTTLYTLTAQNSGGNANASLSVSVCTLKYSGTFGGVVAQTTCDLINNAQSIIPHLSPTALTTTFLVGGISTVIGFAGYIWYMF